MNISKRGRTFTGLVVSDRMSKTVVVEWERRKYVPKYERYSKQKTRVYAHNPEDINAKSGQMVRIMETRPLSKTKKFIVTEVLGEGNLEPEVESVSLKQEMEKQAKPEEEQQKDEKSKKPLEEANAAKKEEPAEQPKGAAKKTTKKSAKKASKKSTKPTKTKKSKAKTAKKGEKK